MTKEHLPVNEYIAAIDEVGDFLREPHHHPERTGIPTDMSDMELGLAAYYANNPNSRKPDVMARLARQQAQSDALETYRPNFIASEENNHDQILGEIEGRKNEIKRNTPFFRRMGKNFMTAVSYVPGLDTLVGMHEINHKARLNSIDRNFQAYLSNPSGIRLESANEVHTKKYGGKNSYAKSYDKSLKSHRRHESRKHVFELESEIIQLKEDIARLNLNITELRNGRPL